jgi:hypothetical protein
MIPNFLQYESMGSIKKAIKEADVEATYSLGVRHLRSMRMRGIGPRWIKVSGKVGHRGGRVLYPVAELEAWLAQMPGGGGRAA